MNKLVDSIKNDIINILKDFDFEMFKPINEQIEDKLDNFLVNKLGSITDYWIDVKIKNDYDYSVDVGIQIGELEDTKLYYISSFVQTPIK